MKKSVKIILSLLSLSIIGTGTAIVVANSQGLNFDATAVKGIENLVEIVSQDVDSITIKKTDDSKFKVMMFTDVHLNGKKTTDKMAMEYLIKNITEGKPDLVVFGGDTISSGFNKKRTEEFAKAMETTGVYWTAVLGNHEGEGLFTYSRKEVVELFASYDHCLLKVGKEGVDGNGNCTINILNSDNSLKEVFFLMDSGNYMTKELKEKYGVKAKGTVYDGTKESQVEWYNQKHDEISALYGDFKSIAVVHIPPYQTKVASEGEYLYGVKNEGTCESRFDSGFFDALKQKGSTQAVYFGHDHINDFGVMYEGILLSYIQPSGYGSYTMKSSKDAPENEWLQGCTVLTLNNDGTYEAQRIFNHK